MAIGILLAAGGVAVGIFGSLLGLGGGILIVPLLTTAFGVPFREAVGVSLVCVVVTSSAAAGVYLDRHVANLRLGMVLEVFTAGGALVGGLVAFLLPERVLAALFALLLAYTGASMLRGAGRGNRPAVPATTGPPGMSASETSADADDGGSAAAAPAAGAVMARAEPVAAPATAVAAPATAGPEAPADPPGADDADPTFMDRLGGPGYRPRRLGLGMAGGLLAGVVSALLGVGGGIVKVPLMYLAMGVPLKVATATSNLMIGVTGTASAVVYLARGEVDPFVAGPTAVGVFAGALVGSRLAPRVDLRLLRLVFVAVMAINAVQMIARALG